MGLKLKPKSKLIPNEPESLKEDIFTRYCKAYHSQIKENLELTELFISGLRQQSKNFTLESFIRFYAIFVNKIASLEDKVKFFTYYFIPYQIEWIHKEEVLEILKILCRSLPKMTQLNVKADLLSK
jgi:hypothetical protein